MLYYSKHQVWSRRIKTCCAPGPADAAGADGGVVACFVKLIASCLKLLEVDVRMTPQIPGFHTVKPRQSPSESCGWARHLRMKTQRMAHNQHPSQARKLDPPTKSHPHPLRAISAKPLSRSASCFLAGIDSNLSGRRQGAKRRLLTRSLAH